VQSSVSYRITSLRYVSCHPNVRSTVNLVLYTCSLKFSYIRSNFFSSFVPRLFGLMTGIISKSSIRLLLSIPLNPESSVRNEPERSNPTRSAISARSSKLCGSKVLSCRFTGLTLSGAIMNPLLSAILSSFIPF